MHESRQDIQDELRDIAPLLSESFSSLPEGEAPAGFFEEMQSNVLSSITPVVALEPTRKSIPWKWLALAAILAGAGIFITQSIDDAPQDTPMVSAVQESEIDDDVYLDILMDFDDDLVYEVYAGLDEEDSDLESTIDWLIEEGIEYDDLINSQIQEI